MTAAPPFSIRPTVPDDLEVLVDLEAEAFASASWGAEGMRTAFWTIGNKTLIAAGLGDVPQGFAIWRNVADEAEILTIGVVPPARRCGVARLLLTRVIEEARALGVESLFLEVRSQNEGAIGLYGTAGFETVGARRRYYKDGDDALIMQLNLTISGVDPSL